MKTLVLTDEEFAALVEILEDWGSHDYAHWYYATDAKTSLSDKIDALAACVDDTVGVVR